MTEEALDPVEARLEELGMTLPPPRAAGAKYKPWIISGNRLYISGQVSALGSESVLGRVGEAMDLDGAVGAARVCGLNLLAQMKHALGGFERVVCILKVNGYVQVAGEFDAIPQVMDGCSSILQDVLGDRAGHARSSVGVARLPGNHTVEVDALVEFLP